MLVIGSAIQATALLLYIFFNSLWSLWVISGLFGLFQGGIVPMYPVIIRQFLPPREAGARISLVLTATVLGMAFGGLAAGYIYDVTHSYRLAFLHGLLWNLVNLALVGWLMVGRNGASAARLGAQSQAPGSDKRRERARLTAKPPESVADRAPSLRAQRDPIVRTSAGRSPPVAA